MRKLLILGLISTSLHAAGASRVTSPRLIEGDGVEDSETKTDPLSSAISSVPAKPNSRPTFKSLSEDAILEAEFDVSILSHSHILGIANRIAHDAKERPVSEKVLSDVRTSVIEVFENMSVSPELSLQHDNLVSKFRIELPNYSQLEMSIGLASMVDFAEATEQMELAGRMNVLLNEVSPLTASFISEKLFMGLPVSEAAHQHQSHMEIIMKADANSRRELQSHFSGSNISEVSSSRSGQWTDNDRFMSGIIAGSEMAFKAGGAGAGAGAGVGTVVPVLGNFAGGLAGAVLGGTVGAVVGFMQGYDHPDANQATGQKITTINTKVIDNTTDTVTKSKTVTTENLKTGETKQETETTVEKLPQVTSDKPGVKTSDLNDGCTSGTGCGKEVVGCQGGEDDYSQYGKRITKAEFAQMKKEHLDPLILNAFDDPKIITAYRSTRIFIDTGLGDDVSNWGEDGKPIKGGEHAIPEENGLFDPQHFGSRGE